MRELLSNNSLVVGQLYEDKSLALRACDLSFFTTDLQTVNYYSKFTARAEVANHHQTDTLARAGVRTKINSDCDQFQV